MLESDVFYMKNIKLILIDKTNRSGWWHVRPADPDAYKKRENFSKNTFLKADFYGKPNDVSDRASISNPIYGFSRIAILKKLFPMPTRNFIQGFLIQKLRIGMNVE